MSEHAHMPKMVKRLNCFQWKKHQQTFQEPLKTVLNIHLKTLCRYFICAPTPNTDSTHDIKVKKNKAAKYMHMNVRITWWSVISRVHLTPYVCIIMGWVVSQYKLYFASHKHKWKHAYTLLGILFQYTDTIYLCTILV